MKTFLWDQTTKPAKLSSGKYSTLVLLKRSNAAATGWSCIQNRGSKENSVADGLLPAAACLLLAVCLISMLKLWLRQSVKENSAFGQPNEPVISCLFFFHKQKTTRWQCQYSDQTTSTDLHYSSNTSSRLVSVVFQIINTDNQPGLFFILTHVQNIHVSW